MRMKRIHKSNTKPYKNQMFYINEIPLLFHCLYVFIFIDMLKTVDESLFLYILSISQLPVTVLGYYFHSVPQFSP